MTMLDIDKDIYLMLTDRAKQQNARNLKEYANKKLNEWLEKDEMISRYAPNLSVFAIEQDRLTIADSKAKILVDIYSRNGTVYCATDNTTDCMHTRYAWAIPEITIFRDQLSHNVTENHCIV